MTFKDIQDRVLQWLDEAGDEDTTRELAKQAIVSAHKKRIGQIRWPFMLWPRYETLTVTQGVQDYALHPEFFKPERFFNVTQQFPVTIYDKGTAPAVADPFSDTGPALHAQLLGRTAVAAQPSVASVLTLSSSNIMDNGAVVLKVRGVTSTGVQTESITCGGAGTVQFLAILNVTKSGTAAIGTLTLTSNAAAVTNLVLFATEFSRSYQQLTFLQIPAAAETIAYRFYRRPSPLVDDNDSPDIPEPFDEILIFDTLIAFASYNSYDPQTVQLWIANRDELKLSFEQAFDQTDAVDAATHYTTFVER